MLLATSSALFAFCFVDADEGAAQTREQSRHTRKVLTRLWKPYTQGHPFPTCPISDTTKVESSPFKIGGLFARTLVLHGEDLSR